LCAAAKLQLVDREFFLRYGHRGADLARVQQMLRDRRQRFRASLGRRAQVADAVRDERDESPRFRFAGPDVVADAAVPHTQCAVKRADEEVIGIRLPDAALVRQAEEVDIGRDEWPLFDRRHDGLRRHTMPNMSPSRRNGNTKTTLVSS